MINKKDAQKVLKIKNQARAIWKPLIDFIKKNGGEEKLKEIEKRLDDLGAGLSFKDFNKIRFYSLGQLFLFLLVIKEVLGWRDEKIEEMGRNWIKRAMVNKFFSYLFRANRDFFFKKVPVIGRRVMLDMKVVPLEIDLKKNKMARIRIEGVMMKYNEKDPILKETEKVAKVFFGGFFATFTQIILGVGRVNFEVEHNERGFVFTFKW